MKLLPREDLKAIVDSVDWEPLRGARTLLTGGTGWVGSWLVESFHLANREYDLKAKMVVLTRDRWAAWRKFSQLVGDESLEFKQGDMRGVFLNPGEGFTHFIHGAGETADPLVMWDVTVGGTRHLLDWARDKGIKRTLYLSSGAAFHRPRTVYGQCKRAAEDLCAIFTEEGLPIVIARPYAFVGPGLPLTDKFAIGAFIRDAIAGGPVRVTGGQSVYRSYLYASDMATWLWTLLLRGEPGSTVEVGSEVHLPISELAGIVAQTLGVNLERIPAEQDADCYLPDVFAAHSMGLKQTVPLREAIERTARFAQTS